ncbi:hypothetical protein Tco_0152489 [Tanacetum coccineum]
MEQTHQSQYASVSHRGHTGQHRYNIRDRPGMLGLLPPRSSSFISNGFHHHHLIIIITAIIGGLSSSSIPSISRTEASAGRAWSFYGCPHPPEVLKNQDAQASIYGDGGATGCMGIPSYPYTMTRENTSSGYLPPSLPKDSPWFESVYTVGIGEQRMMQKTYAER